MRTLVYKRTHVGDPDESGEFGTYDCMGQVRAWEFDAVIGVGGVGREERSEGIAGKLNWIGIGARRHLRGDGPPTIAFDRFLLLEAHGPSLNLVAPRLARRVYSKNVRVMIVESGNDLAEEADRLLDPASSAPPSRARRAMRRSRVKC